MKNGKCIEIYRNGDPYEYEGGFTGIEYENLADYNSGHGIFRGDLSPMTREAWRKYAKKYGYILRYR